MLGSDWRCSLPRTAERSFSECQIHSIPSKREQVQAEFAQESNLHGASAVAQPLHPLPGVLLCKLQPLSGLAAFDKGVLVTCCAEPPSPTSHPILLSSPFSRESDF